jgi:hypothetical protein
MFCRLILVLSFAVSSASMAQSVPELGEIDGVVIHNLSSSSEITLHSGTWNQCSQPEEMGHRIDCELSDSYASIGSKRIDLNIGRYLAPSEYSKYQHYYFFGEAVIGSVGGPVRRILLVVLVDPATGKKRGYLDVPDFGLKEQMSFD